MLRGNLSTRPFYNERAVSVALLFGACCVVLLTAVNAWYLVSLSSERRAKGAEISRDRQEAGRVRAEAASVQRTVDRARLTELAASTREANSLIDQRTFSWTSFFGFIEKTLPIDVRLVMVSPRPEKGVFRVSMTVIARDLSDVDDFIDQLQATGAFYDVVPTEQQAKEDRTYTAVLEASYLPPAPPPAAPKITTAPTAVPPPAAAQKGRP